MGASESLIIIGGSLLAAVSTVANVLALYYAYLIDRPALTVNLRVEQIGPTEVNATCWSRSRLKTTVC